MPPKRRNSGSKESGTKKRRRMDASQPPSSGSWRRAPAAAPAPAPAPAAAADPLEGVQLQIDDARAQLQAVGRALDSEEAGVGEVPGTPPGSWSSAAHEYPMMRGINDPAPDHDFSEQYSLPTEEEQEQIQIDRMMRDATRMRTEADRIEAEARERESSLRMSLLQDSAYRVVNRVVTPIRGALSDAASSARRTSETLLLPGARAVAQGAANAVARPARAASLRARPARAASRRRRR